MPCMEAPPRKIRGVHVMMWLDPEEEKRDRAAGHTTPKEIARMLREQLEGMRHFTSLSSVAVEELAGECEFWSYNPGDVILSQGRPGRFLLFVMSGSAAVYKRKSEWRRDSTFAASTSSSLSASSPTRENGKGVTWSNSVAHEHADGVGKQQDRAGWSNSPRRPSNNLLGLAAF